MIEFQTKELQYGSINEDSCVLIVDGIMGCGKTTSIINYINNAPEDSKFVYVTPFLSEVTRIKEACKEKNFHEPLNRNAKGSKLEGFQKMIEAGTNIVTTHALFQLLGNKDLDLFKFNDYTLVMDEVANVIEPFYLSESDTRVIFEEAKLASINDEGKIIWQSEDYKGKFDDFRRQVEMGNMYCHNGQFFLWTFPIELFKSFSKTFILTYMFDGQIQSGYYKLNQVNYKYVHVKSERNPERDEYNLSDYQFVDQLFDEPMQCDNSELFSLINICENNKWNLIGNDKYALSKTWYQKSDVKAEVTNLDILRNKCRRFFVSTCSNVKDFMWTTFSDYQAQVSRRDFSKGFVSCTSRATNEYSNRKSLAYLVNRFINPAVKQFLISKGAGIDEDLYSLSELLQWIFRSQIRNNKPIELYIPSKRMRQLLIDWGNNKI